MRSARHLGTLLLAGSLCACAGKAGKGTPDNAPTLKTLSGREMTVAPDPGVQADESRAIAAYRSFLDGAPDAPQRAQALRRVGDLEMDRADTRSATAESAAAPDYRAAIARYQEFLRTYPKDPSNDRVLYQLARAQEQSGQLETALKTLDRLVAQYPATSNRDEAEFRRGELLFTTKDYVNAERAYTQVLRGAADNPYRDRALYMQGWSRFKQGRLEDALASFFGVLDLKVVGVETLAGLPRGERELVEDTFRVTSLSLASLEGAASIPAFITTPERRDYEFRVYQNLAELYIRQDRTKDAADAFGAFVRREPLHAQAPVLQARVIEIYAQGSFATLALEAKKDYVTRYGVDSEFRRANAPAWERAQPLVKTHLAELARHYHALAQAGKRSADYQQAVLWYRLYLRSFPADADAAQSNFLLAELLFEDRRFAEAAVEYERTAYALAAHPRSADAGYAALLSYAAQEKSVAATEAAALQREGVASALRFADAFVGDPRVPAVLTHAAERMYALQEAIEAEAIARRVLALAPPPTPEQRRVAWTVIAHASFEAGRFDAAEQAYAQAIALAPESGRKELTERLAASVYKQGEQARTDGKGRDAATHFARVATVAPQSAVRATAQYDAAAALIGLQDWDGAAATLEDFRRRYPDHALQGDATDKLALAHLERKQWALAAAEFERIAARPDPAQARAAQWQAAEL
ncbi:MAG TPA: tetratricopeptide repeat protein, partial [Burkholderiaceae bacterium]|nr:tetratricopeptide repeat protein [Burkholderiaceae bacterium]